MLEDDKFRLKNIDVDCKRLWKAVVLQIILDIYSFKKEFSKNLSLSQKESFKNKRKAEFFLNSADFDIICEYANLDPNFIRENKEKIYQRIIKTKIK